MHNNKKKYKDCACPDNRDRRLTSNYKEVNLNISFYNTETMVMKYSK